MRVDEALTGIRPITEQRPLKDIDAAYVRMMSGATTGRMVLTTDR
ncbi:Hypothetical protein A7982_06455 [Minicystis rosea]|nr:Hypothetical protein A7982_06455 [Minicystis rosea]